VYQRLTKNKEHSSPAVEEPPVGQSIIPTLSSHDINQEIYATPRESRSNSRASETSHTNTIEKWEVFRDEEAAPRSSAPKQLRTTGGLNLPGTPRARNDCMVHDEHAQPPNPDTASITHLTQTLRAIAATRTSLLRQLDDLQIQENDVLTLFTQVTTRAPPLLSTVSTLASPSPPLPPPTQCRPLNAPLLQTPRPQTFKIPKKKSHHTRTVSAPEIATPKSVRQSTRGRVVLGDKTPVIEDERLVVETPHFPATSIQRSVNRRDGLAKVQRVPIHFGDEDEEPESLAGRARETSSSRISARSRSSSRGRGSDRGGRNRSRSETSRRAPDTPAAKMRGGGGYKVPDTVARKKWDF
jgi:hypothetical protein